MLHKLSYTKILVFFLLMQGAMFCHAQIAYLAFNSTTVKAYDVNTNTVLANIPVSESPIKVIPHPDGTKAYLFSNSIQVLDVATQTITNTINVTETLMSTCISYDGQFLYFNTLVPNTYPYEIKLYKLNTQTNVVSYLTSLQNGYYDMSISPNDDKLYLVGNSEAIVFNTTNFSNYITIPFLVYNNYGQTMCCLNNDGSKLFVTGETLGRFNIINTLNYTVDTSCLFGPNGGFYSASCMQYNPVTNSIYVAGIDGTSAGKWISYNIATNQVESTINFNPFLSPLSMEINEEGTLCYTVGGQLIHAGTMRTINTTNNTILPGVTNIGTISNRSKNFIVKLRPEIDIQVGPSNQSITDGDHTPSLSDKTDFGNVNTTGYATQMYKIKNTGLAPLHVPTISLTGPNASMFTISAMPMDIPVGGVDSFAVYFYPSSPGTKTAVVNIDNNDFNEGAYDFAIQGTGTLPKYVYTTQAAANTVGVIDRNTNQHVMDINVGSYPNGLCFNPSRSKLFVTNSNSNDVSVINTITNSVMHTIPVGSYPVGICASPNGNKLYVANQNSNSVSVINVSTQTIDATIPVGNLPFGICISLDGSKVFVSNNGSNTVSVINTATNTISATLNVGLAPKGITINPSGTIVYVANSGSNNVSSFNVSNHSMNPNVNVGTSPYSICFNATGTKYFVSNYIDFTISSVPIAGGFFQTIAVGNYPAGLSLSDDGSQLWVTNYGTDNMSVINTSNNAVINTINIGSGPISFGNSIATIGVPEIKVKGGNIPLLLQIENYDYTPSVYDNTNMGNVNAGSNLTKTFYIQNTGSSELVINGIDVYGPDASMFGLNQVPNIIAAGTTDSFKITFTSTAGGTKLAYVHIASNVPNLQNFYYGLQGEGAGLFEFSGQIKLFLQGYYQGNSLMQSALLNQNWPAASSTQTDFISVELHNPNFPHELMFTYSGVLQTDGIFAGTFPNATLGHEYYLVIKHRNSIETWSANPVLLSNQFNYDFTTAATQAYGDNQVEVEPGVFAIYTGDMNQDGFVDSFDFPTLDTDIFNGVSSMYVNTDLNGDGFVDSFDFPLFDVNSFNGVSMMTPG